MRDYAAACWETCQQLHMLMLDDEQVWSLTQLTALSHIAHIRERLGPTNRSFSDQEKILPCGEAR